MRGGRCALRGRLLGVIRVLVIRVPGGRAGRGRVVGPDVVLAAGSATSYAISATGDVYAWGVGHVGQVGDGHARTAVTSVVVATGAASISATANNVVISFPRKLRP